MVEKKPFKLKIIKPIPAKKEVKSSLSPTSYQNLESFRSTQIKKPNVYISKYKNENFMQQLVKQNKWKPGSGTYDHNKGSNMTKGLAKGWK